MELSLNQYHKTRYKYTYNQTIDQAQVYISVNSENGMLCLPTRLNGFKQTHFKVEISTDSN